MLCAFSRCFRASGVWAQPCQYSARQQSGCYPGLGSYLEAWRALELLPSPCRLLAEFLSCGCKPEGPSFLASCQPKRPRLLEAACCFLSHDPFHRSSHNMPTCCFKASKRERDWVCWQNRCYNVAWSLRVISRHLYHILEASHRLHSQAGGGYIRAWMPGGSGHVHYLALHPS